MYVEQWLRSAFCALGICRVTIAGRVYRGIHARPSKTGKGMVVFVIELQKEIFCAHHEVQLVG